MDEVSDTGVASLGDAVPAARALLAAVDTPTEVSSLSDEALEELLVQARRLQSQAEGIQVALVAEGERRELAAARSLASGADWVSQLTSDSREVAAGGIWIAGALTTRYAATLDALSAGLITLDQAKVIVKAADQIPAHATPAQVALAEDWILAKASGAGNRHGRPMTTKDLRRAARRMCAVVSKELADEHEALMLNKKSTRAENETWFSLQDRGDGTYQGRFVIPELHGLLLKTFLERLSAPRKRHRDCSSGSNGSGGSGQPDEDPTLPGDGELTWSEHLGLALCELVENLPEGGWSRNGINIVVTTDLDTLKGKLAAAGLETGDGLAPGDLRRLACGAGILPAILDGNSMPLDLGRTKRLHDRYQRIALSLTHTTCAAAGCTRPFAWTEIHHPLAWADGGTTDLHNALPLCHWHHRRAHDPAWHLHQDAHGTWRFKRTRYGLIA